MKDKLWLVYLNVSLICVLLVGMELVGQVSYFAFHGYPLFESAAHAYRVESQIFELRPTHAYRAENQIFELHPYLVGRLKKNVRIEQDNKTISTTDFHTRWTGAPTDDQNAIRIAVLGGSSTFGTRVTDADSWTALLQHRLGNEYSVINYGVPGYSTAEAIIQMALIVPERKPHVVVFYEGWNDIKNYHDGDLGPDYFGHGMKEYQELRIPVTFGDKQEPLSTRLVQISALVRFASRLAEMLPRKEQRPPQTSAEAHTTPDPFVDRIYLRNLKTLKTLARSLDAKAIFVPQVLNYDDFRGRTVSRRWSPHIEDDAMPALLDRFNSIMKNVCLPEEPECLVLNEVLAERWTSSDFVDDGHFSRAGGVKFSNLVARHIRSTDQAVPRRQARRVEPESSIVR
jgi:lysophospholipase L1-like esterase